MSASTAAREANRKPGNLVAYAQGVCKINKGTHTVIRSDGYLYPLRAPAVSQADVYAGVAYGTFDNTGGTAGANYMLVNKTGSFVFNKTSPAQTDIGVAFYGVDDQTVSATSTNAVLVGYAEELDASGLLRIRIDRAVQ